MPHKFQTDILRLAYRHRLLERLKRAQLCWQSVDYEHQWSVTTGFVFMSGEAPVPWSEWVLVPDCPHRYQLQAHDTQHSSWIDILRGCSCERTCEEKATIPALSLGPIQSTKLTAASTAQREKAPS